MHTHKEQPNSPHTFREEGLSVIIAYYINLTTDFETTLHELPSRTA